MQFDPLDKKVRDAAGYHHPPYDEDAWKKMEKLLDRQMPQKKEDKKKNYFLFVVVYVTGRRNLVFCVQ